MNSLLWALLALACVATTTFAEDQPAVKAPFSYPGSRQIWCSTSICINHSIFRFLTCNRTNFVYWAHFQRWNAIGMLGSCLVIVSDRKQMTKKTIFYDALGDAGWGILHPIIMITCNFLWSMTLWTCSCAIPQLSACVKQQKGTKNGSL